MNRAAHIILGVGISIFVLYRFSPESHIPLIVLGSGIGSMFPDLDRRKGHRKLLHSIFSLFILSLTVFFIAIYLKIPLTLPASFFLGYASHILGDMVTYRGVALLFPFRNKYYRSPLPLGRSSDLGVNMLGIALGILLMILGMVARP